MTAGAVAAPLIIPIIPLQTHRSKNCIDTSTPVSIQSDTPGVLIFYTLDGSKPAAPQRGSAGRGRKYSEPVLLPAGKVAVRALAATSDGRESATVTKIFLVEPADSKNGREDEENLLTSAQPRLSVEAVWSAGDSAASPLRPPEPKTAETASPQSRPRFLNSRLGDPTAAPQPGSSQHSQPAKDGSLKQHRSTQTSRIQRETDFLRCTKCLSWRPSDPFARFCAQCGAVVPPLPEHRLPPTEGGQMVRCLFCDALIPVNTHTCLICEASIHQQLPPQSSLRLQDHVLCVCCGQGNPAHVSSCLTCENRLQPVVCVGNGAPPVLSVESRMLSCPKCKRRNHSDARYCDWCGSKANHAVSCVTCWRCGASGHPYAFYCIACGVFLEAPVPPTTSAAGKVSALASHDASCQAMPPPDSGDRLASAPPTTERHTQTVGIYYPSATKLLKKEEQRALLLSRQSSRDRQPLLTAISPGRGYWRKQLEHVCAHLKSYTQNNAPFRALLGEPRLGRMVSAVIQEDHYEVSFTISFVSAGAEEKQVGPAGDAASLPASRRETLSSVTERSSASSKSDRPADPTKRPKPNPAPKPPARDGQLLKELGPGPGRGQISVIRQLLDQGADPCCCGSEGLHALAVAVVNGHHDALPVLVQRGADVNQQSGAVKNTALHEAAALGSQGLRCAEVLLSCKAGVKRRNAAGQTAYDVAVSSGCNDMVSLLAARTGQDLLDKLGKPKPNLDAH